ncbi:MAG: AsnC family transcriptional regulator, partial [Actinobacteria bacterium]|nr:AsnC family transcriptional regulator [Actinomycetota bacterium]
MKEELDAYDKKILFELDINSRMSASKIAKKIKIPKETVNYRIKRLEKNGWINRLYTIFNASLFGYSYYRVFLKFYKLTSSTETEIIDYITNDSTCANLRIIEGPFDLVFLTIQKNPGDLKGFLQCFFNIFGKYVEEKNVLMMMKTHKLNQKFLLEGKTIKKTFNHVDTKDYTLDKIDLGIMKSISTDARTKLSDIAQFLHVDSRLIEYHIKKMERSGIIVAYTTDLNLVQLNRELIQIDIALKDPVVIPGIINFFDKTNTCVFVHEMLGKYDLSVEIYVEKD